MNTPTEPQSRQTTAAGNPNPDPNPSQSRSVARLIQARSAIEGGGFEVYRPFPGPDADWLDPFLLLDEMGPQFRAPGEAIGAPDHPHRGFETVTYILKGEVEHRDSAGNHGLIGPGDVQWMTAGDGIVHSEMPSSRVQAEGGLGHGLQLWVNLPAALRRTAPKYQGLPAANIATASGDGWTAEVVAGSMLGVSGPAETHTPVGYARVTMQPGASLRIPVEDGHTALVYGFEGQGAVGSDEVRLDAHTLAVLHPTGGDIVLSVPEELTAAFDCVVLTGEPINEPMARYGPFVMNTKAEINEAIDDFNAGRMGSIPAIGTV